MVDLTKPVAVMCFSGGSGGMERSAVRLARFLSSITTVVLVCKKSSFTERLHTEEVGNNYACEPIDFYSRVFSPVMLFKARSIISKYGIENVIFFGASELKTLYFSFLGMSINLIVWHGTTKSKAKRDFFHRLVYSKVNYHVALSDHLIRNVKKIVPEGKGIGYKVIRPSFDFNVHLKNNATENKKELNILHIGRVANGKGQVDAVKACKVLQDNNIAFHLTLIGTPDGSQYVRDVKKAIDGLKMNELVTVVGFVDDVSQYFEQADIFLFPSRGEGMPNAFIEALHYDMICIAYDNTVFPEFCDMGFYVHLAEDGNVPDLADKLLYAARNISSEKSRAINNTDLSRRYFQVERELSEWREILI